MMLKEKWERWFVNLNTCYVYILTAKDHRK